MRVQAGGGLVRLLHPQGDMRPRISMPPPSPTCALFSCPTPVSRLPVCVLPCPFSSPVKVGITLRDASKGAQPLPILILKEMDKKEGDGAGGLAWTSYETGEAVNPFRPEHVELLSMTHSLAVTGKVLVAALEAHPSFSKGLQYVKVRALFSCVCVCVFVGVCSFYKHVPRLPADNEQASVVAGIKT